MKITINLVLTFFLLFSNVRECSIFELEDVVYPQEIVISKNWERKVLDLVKIYLRYKGEDVIIEKGKSGYPSRSIRYALPLKVYFYLKKKVMIKEEYQGGATMDMGTKDDKMVLFASNAIYLFQLSWEVDKELEEAIGNKELSKIIVHIDKLKISWSAEGETIYPELKEGECQIKINKTLKIKVKYER